MKKYLVRFDFGNGDAFLESIEVLSEEEFKLIEDFASSDKEVYLGEIAGKHSEVYGPLDRGDYQILTQDPEIIKPFETLLNGSFGAFDMLESIKEALYES